MSGGRVKEVDTLSEGKKETNNMDIILSQWQTCVEMANSVSQRRDIMNNIFVTVNLTLMTAVSITWDVKAIFVLVAGIVICILWKLFIRNYKLLNKAKFDVIQSLEKKLPSTPFSDEWKILCKTKKYKDGTWLETVLPFTFIGLYTVAIMTIVAIRLFS